MSKKDEPRKVGRPTKYTDEYSDKLLKYVEQFEEYEVYQEETASQGRAVTVTKSRSNGIPTVEGFLLETDIVKDTFYNWVTQHPKFSDAFNKLKSKQKSMIIKGGLNGTFNAGFAKFVATNCTDMKDSSHVEQTNKNIEIKIDSEDEKL